VFVKIQGRALLAIALDWTQALFCYHENILRKKQNSPSKYNDTNSIYITYGYACIWHCPINEYFP